MNKDYQKWFSDPQLTLEDAQALHQPKPLDFEPAAVYKTPDNQFVMGYLRVQNWSMNFVKEVASRIEEMTGYKMVSHCEPLLGIWSKL